MTDKLEPITDATLANLEALRRSKTASKIDVAFTVSMHVTSMITRIRTDAAEIKRLREALVGVTELYVELANSGDCGSWNPEEEPEIKQARAALKGGE